MTIDFTKVGQMAKVTLTGSDQVTNRICHRSITEIDFNRKDNNIIGIEVDRMGGFDVPINDLTFEGNPITIDQLDAAIEALFPNAGGSASPTLTEEITLTGDGSFTMNNKKKLLSIAAKNNSSELMNLQFTATDMEQVDLEVPVDGNADVLINKTFWALTTVNVLGVTGSITLLISRI